MAAAKESPVLANPLVARAALEADLPKVLQGRSTSWDESGWLKIDDLTLLIPLKAGSPNQAMRDEFWLRLAFHYYRDWPPSAQFVNPRTKGFDPTKDRGWLPRIENGEIHVHENYGNKSGQVICCSATFEFYKVLHDVQPQHVWDSKRQNFAHTLNQIEWGLQWHYKGRFGELAA